MSRRAIDERFSLFGDSCGIPGREATMGLSPIGLTTPSAPHLPVFEKSPPALTRSKTPEATSLVLAAIVIALVFVVLL